MGNSNSFKGGVFAVVKPRHCAFACLRNKAAEPKGELNKGQCVAVGIAGDGF